MSISQSGNNAKPQVGFIGLGNMGKFMAINLAKSLANSNHPKLIVWNRTESKSNEAVHESNGQCRIAQSVKEVATTCDVIFCSLANDTVVQSIYEQMLPVHRDNALFVETSTIYPDVMMKIEQDVRATGKGASFVAALPFGRSIVAQKAELVFAIGGEAQAAKRATNFIVPAMGRAEMQFGSDVRKASTFKLIGNSIVLSTIEMMAESMTLAEKSGIGADRVLEWVHLFYPAPTAITYATKVAQNHFPASGGFDLQGGLKDATHINSLANEVGCPMHIVQRATEHLKMTIEANKDKKEDMDWSALAAGQRIESGLPPFPSS